MINREDLIGKLWRRDFIYKRSGRNLLSAVSFLELIRIVKKNIAVMCWQNCKSAKDIYIQAMEITNIRREFIVYKYCIRNKTTGGKIFFKIINNGNCAKFEFKSFGKGENNVGKKRC